MLYVTLWEPGLGGFWKQTRNKEKQEKNSTISEYSNSENYNGMLWRGVAYTFQKQCWKTRVYTANPTEISRMREVLETGRKKDASV